SRIDNWIDPAHSHSSADHAPEGLDISKCQAEHDGQKGTLEVPHRVEVLQTSDSEKGQSGEPSGKAGEGRYLLFFHFKGRELISSALGCIFGRNRQALTPL